MNQAAPKQRARAGFAELDILDLVLHNEITPEGDWPSIIVYFTRPS